jgi:hypothetical protein
MGSKDEVHGECYEGILNAGLFSDCRQIALLSFNQGGIPLRNGIGIRETHSFRSSGQKGGEASIEAYCPVYSE